MSGMLQKFHSFHPISLIFLDSCFVILFHLPSLHKHSHSFTFIVFSYDLTGLKWSTWPDKAVYGVTLSVAKDTGQTNSTRRPRHTQDQDPHLSPNTLNPEDFPLCRPERRLVLEQQETTPTTMSGLIWMTLSWFPYILNVVLPFLTLSYPFLPFLGCWYHVLGSCIAGITI